MDSKRVAERTHFLLQFLDLPRKWRLIMNLSGGQQRSEILSRKGIVSRVSQFCKCLSYTVLPNPPHYYCVLYFNVAPLPSPPSPPPKQKQVLKSVYSIYNLTGTKPNWALGKIHNLDGYTRPPFSFCHNSKRINTASRLPNLVLGALTTNIVYFVYTILRVIVKLTGK
jgi:hypothetical protein